MMQRCRFGDFGDVFTDVHDKGALFLLSSLLRMTMGWNKDTKIPQMPCPDFLFDQRLAFSSASHSINRTITYKSDFFTQPSEGWRVYAIDVFMIARLKLVVACRWQRLLWRRSHPALLMQDPDMGGLAICFVLLRR